jgi:5-methylthioadenosine/S-adenosylhomocysteine deaminase
VTDTDAPGPTADAVVVTADRALAPPPGALASAHDRARRATSVLAIDGAIVRVGDPDEVAADPRAAGARRIAWPGRAMVPGTVNTHNHSFQSLLRGIGDDLPFLEWRDRALYRYSPRLDAGGMATAALFAFGEMLLHGVTTVCDFYYLNRGGNDHAAATIEAARRLGIRIVLARCFYDWTGAPEAYRETVPQAVANFEALFRRYHDRDRCLVSIQPAPHSQHGATPAMIEAGAGCARDAGVPWHIHLAEERYQVDQSLERYGARPLHAVAALPVDLAQMIAVHGCWFDAGERAVLAERGGALAYCPGSNMFLGDGVTDLVDLVGRGVPVGLGTDGGCSNSRVSVFDEMRTAALLQKVHRTDGQAIDAETCYALGTRTAGAVLRLPVGRIAPGYRCDLVALDLDDPSLWPVQALEKNVVYSLSPRAIRDVVVDGQEVVAARRLCHVALDEIQARVRDVTELWELWESWG